MNIKNFRKPTLNDYSFGILIVLAFLLPIFFLPLIGISIDYIKNALLQILIVVSLILWLIARLKTGKLLFPKTYLLYFVFLIPATFLISSFYSLSIGISMFGFGDEIGTFITILVLFLAMFLSSIYFQTIGKVFYLYSGILVAFIILATYHLARLILGADFLSFNIFTFPSSSLIGRWNDLAVFFGFTSILSLLAIYIPRSGIIIKILMILVLAISLFFVALINFSLVWILIFILSLIIFVYAISFSGEQSVFDGEEFKINMNMSAMLPIFVSVISILFLIPGNPVGDYLAQKFNVSYIEARPSWSTTIDIAKNTLKEDFILGVGPNKFRAQWSKFKPISINESVFWKTNFNFGVGIIPSFAVTTGFLGIIVWVAFLAMLAFMGGRFAMKRHRNKTVHYIVFSSFVFTLYLWSASIFYVPSISIFALAFLMTGVFVASLVMSGNIKNLEFSFLENQKIGFVSVLVIILLIIASIVGGYFFVQRTVSAYFFSSGIKEFNINRDVISAETAILKATKLYKSDIYYRLLSETQIAKINIILSQNKLKKEEIKANFQKGLGNAINSARQAISLDKTNYLNWISLGNVYGSIIPAGVVGAYENAISSYNNALALNPTSPEIHLILAKTEISKGNFAKSKEHIRTAIKLKSNYIEAIFLLSQVQANEGDLSVAIKTVLKASALSPNNMGIFFQLGFLMYQNKDYNGAISALERAVTLQPVYSNAKYFLGLSYSQVGRVEDAILQFKDIEYLNPDNVGVKKILNNLTNERVPFVDIAPSLLENKDKLPVKE